MKVLTIRQPWATLIAYGVKTIETRSWAAPRTLIGDRIAIHAAARKVDLGWEGGGLALARIWSNSGGERDVLYGDYYTENDDGLPYGAIIATAALKACVPVDRHAHGVCIGEFPHEGPLPHQQGGLWLTGPISGAPVCIENQRPFGDFAAGRFGWLLADVERLVEPVPFKGGQGLSRSWEPVGELVARREVQP